VILLLKGFRIIDLTTVILGPYATQILGDLGADVIKIESPEGDSVRPIAPVVEPGISAVFANTNRNKRSVVLDLKSADGKAALAELIASGDVFVHNMRQTAIDKLGFGFDAVRALNPRIIYAAGVGFGRDGCYAGRPAYDDVIQAAAGFAGLFQLRDGEPYYVPSIAADKVTGLHLVYAILAALLFREHSGQAPGYVEVPMFETITAFCLSEHLGAATFSEDGKVGYARILSPNRRPYRTRDGWISVLPYSKANWRKVLIEIGRSDVLGESWFADATERSHRIGDLYAMMVEALPGRSTAEWLATFERLDIPCAPVRTPDDLLGDPHLVDTGFFTPVFSSATAVKRTLRQAVRVDGVDTAPDRPPPRLGDDSADVLGALHQGQRTKS
jgi:crotonobetainyl-CoA:carnitine CoA-transferase CaiB-like acyl-CoA transferase